MRVAKFSSQQQVRGSGGVWSTASRQPDVNEAAVSLRSNTSPFPFCSSVTFFFFFPPIHKGERLTFEEPDGIMIAFCDARNPERGVSPITGKWLFSTHAPILYVCVTLSFCVSLFWVQIDKIMSSIGAGIGSGLDIKEDSSGETPTPGACELI